MEIYQDEVEVEILPDGACCTMDEEERSPLDLDECPMGDRFCTVYCEFYDERY